MRHITAQRAREERERAKQATPANAAAIHKKLADRYDALAEREDLIASPGPSDGNPNGRPSV